MYRKLLGGHARAFEFFGGVPQRISYDNSKVLVSKVTGAHERKLTDGFYICKVIIVQGAFLQVARPMRRVLLRG